MGAVPSDYKNHRWKEDESIDLARLGPRIRRDFPDLPIQDGKVVDIFAFEDGHHNGPVCLDCGMSKCHHCNKEIYIQECPAHR